MLHCALSQEESASQTVVRSRVLRQVREYPALALVLVCTGVRVWRVACRCVACGVWRVGMPVLLQGGSLLATFLSGRVILPADESPSRNHLPPSSFTHMRTGCERVSRETHYHGPWSNIWVLFLRRRVRTTYSQRHCQCRNIH